MEEEVNMWTKGEKAQPPINFWLNKLESTQLMTKVIYDKVIIVQLKATN